MFEGRRVVLACRGGVDDILPFIGVGKALQAMGHLPVVATCRSHEMLVRSHGVGFVAVAPHLDQACDDTGLSPAALATRLSATWHGRRFDGQQVVQPHLAQIGLELLRACKGADALVASPRIYWAGMVARRAALPWWSLLTQASDLALGASTDPVVLPGGRMSWAGWLLPRAARLALMRRAWQCDATTRQALNELAGAWGVSADRAAHGGLAPRGALAMFPPGLVRCTQGASWPVPVAWAGVSQFDGRAGPGPGVLQTFLAAGAAPVVLAIRSQDRASVSALYQHASSVCHQLGLRAVFLGGDHALAQACPSTQLVLPWGPLLPLFEQASAVVGTGALMTSAPAALAGVPQLLVPLEGDQGDAAARWAREGGALVLRASQARGEGLAPALLRLVYGGAWQQQARQRAQLLSRVCATRRVAHLVDGYLTRVGRQRCA